SVKLASSSPSRTSHAVTSRRGLEAPHEGQRQTPTCPMYTALYSNAPPHLPQNRASEACSTPGSAAPASSTPKVTTCSRPSSATCVTEGSSALRTSVGDSPRLAASASASLQPSAMESTSP